MKVCLTPTFIIEPNFLENEFCRALFCLKSITPTSASAASATIRLQISGRIVDTTTVANVNPPNVAAESTIRTNPLN